MKSVAIFLVFGIAFCDAEVSRIVGSSAIPIKDRSYQVTLFVNGTYRCGAVIISTTAVITPAQCVQGEAASNITVRAGSEFGTHLGIVYQASSIVIHESYSLTNYDYDIAIVKFETPFALQLNIDLATLPSSGETVPPEAMASVSGWGAISITDTSYPGLLRFIMVPIVTNSLCSSILRRVTNVTERMLCAGFLYKTDSVCAGDIGDALVYGDKVIGLLSWGLECGTLGSPAVYTRIAAVRDWISTEAGV